MAPLLHTISGALARWDRATEHPAYRGAGVALGAGGAAVALAVGPPAALTGPAWATAVVGAVMALWWVGRVLPMAVTGLVPLLAFPALGVVSFRDVAATYFHPLNLLMLGGLLLGHAVERSGLHHRLVATVLGPAWIRRGPRRAVLALMVVAAILSAILSNTAVALMLLPLALGLGRACTEDPRERSAFVLGLAYAASIGGTATLVGTPPNAILAAAAPSVGFAAWMLVGVPFVLVALPVAALLVTRVAIPLPARFVTPPRAPAVAPWTRAEAAVLVVLALAFAGWATRKDIALAEGVRLPGWAGLFPPGYAEDAWVALLGATVLFLAPAPPGAEGRYLLEPRRVERSVPWSVLLLLGGGFALAHAIEASGLSANLAGATAWLRALHDLGPAGPMLAILAIALLMTAVTEVASNTATTQILLPVLAAGAAAAGLDPLLWMVPATLSASCAFMLPVATAPNAIACEAGGVAPADLAWAGLWLNVALAVWIAALTMFLVPAVF
jgi:sodium-dependent dicarboxylate transporter 2/3/5